MQLSERGLISATNAYTMTEAGLSLYGGFKSFTLGYVWVPYTGEVYSPLTSDSALKSRYEKLLA